MFGKVAEKYRAGGRMQTEYAIGAFGGITEQEILSRHNKRLHRALCQVVGEVQSPVQKNGI
mgnify:CR=1 FL=1